MGLILTPDVHGNPKMRAALKMFDKAVDLDPLDKVEKKKKGGSIVVHQSVSINRVFVYRLQKP
jgi:hypothetical protein